VSTEFTPLLSTLGGVLIGGSASLMLLLEGRVTGISGIVGGLFAPKAGDVAWRVAFVVGMALAGVVAATYAPASMAAETNRGPALLIVAGLLVGVGTRIGSGCTSGHGVCGLSRLSPRSLASVMTFMGVGGVVAVVVGRLLGAA
jgi:uncharacterized membrane protein YedE/YeeE